MDWNKHILMFVHHLGMGQTKFESECGLSRGYLSQPRKDINMSALLKIHSKFPELNPLWLAFDEGDMLLGQPPKMPQMQNMGDIGGLIHLLNKAGEENRQLIAENDMLKARLIKKEKMVVGL